MTDFSVILHPVIPSVKGKNVIVPKKLQARPQFLKGHDLRRPDADRFRLISRPGFPAGTREQTSSDSNKSSDLRIELGESRMKHILSSMLTVDLFKDYIQSFLRKGGTP